MTGSSSSFDSAAFSFIKVLLRNFLKEFNCAVMLLFSDGFGGPVRIEYIRSGNAVTGVRYIILSATEHDAGLYFCTATNKFGSDTKQLTLNVQISGGSGSGNRSSNKRSRHKSCKTLMLLLLLLLLLFLILLILLLLLLLLIYLVV